ncbi:MAG: cytochrome C [Halobacteriovoraceae bacterium]|nr:cytochrome C [Halobacteriovoraceae bacterium]
MILATVVVLFFGWAASDKIFFTIISWPDNIPITILLVLVFWLTWYSFYKGVENDKRIESGEPPIEGTPENREKVWAWPNLVYTELFTIILGTVFLIAWSVLFKAPLEEPANPTWAPNPAKAPWYFLGLQEMLVYFDPWIAGVLLPGLIIVGLIAIPYIDINPKGNGYYTFKERKFAISTFMFGWLVLWVFLIITGTFLRGPNWTFYGPFEFWDPHKVVAANNINISEIFWIKILGMGLPHNVLIREIVGILMVLGYLAVGPFLITKYWGKKLLEKMGPARYYIMVYLILIMMGLPIKMYLRWFINLKYIVFMPEFELNI